MEILAFQLNRVKMGVKPFRKRGQNEKGPRSAKSSPVGFIFKEFGLRLGEMAILEFLKSKSILEVGKGIKSTIAVIKGHVSKRR